MNTEIIREEHVTLDWIEQVFLESRAPMKRDSENDLTIVTPKRNKVYLTVLSQSKMVRIQTGILISSPLDRKSQMELANRLNQDYLFATFYFGDHPEILILKYYLLYWGGITEVQLIKSIIQLDSIAVHIRETLPTVLDSLACEIDTEDRETS